MPSKLERVEPVQGVGLVRNKLTLVHCDTYGSGRQDVGLTYTRPLTSRYTCQIGKAQGRKD